MSNRLEGPLRALPALGLMAVLTACISAQALAQDAAKPAVPAAPAAGPTHAFSIDGVYVEACTCKAACPTEITGELVGCDAVGAMQIDHGSYDGADISNTRIAFEVKGSGTPHVYIDAPEKERAAAERFARAALAGLGEIKAVANAKILITGKDGAYTVKVGDGKIFALTTEPVLGGDHKTPCEHHNTQHPLNPTLYQSRVVAGTFADGDEKITLEKGRNSFFNQKMKASGTI